MAYTISNDKALLDIVMIHAFLTQSYWAKGVPYENVKKRIENALCFGVYEGCQQVGFARVISDFESFAYLADVFILESHRGQGLSKMLMSYIMAYPDLQNLKRFILATADAHGLYAQFDFKPLENISRWMEKSNLTIYQKT
jgi:GNAT superfamily N-acetyltransferase